ncbi:MAG: APC family permease [Alphaproteobacteria bacterium]|nr:APC family permease [Alphaproteobacteria bacterium]
MNLSRLLIGRRLANSESEQRKLGAFEGVPAMGLDGLGSSAYGPEAALTIMIPLGAAGLSQIGPVMLAILVLLAILFVSYWQTVEAYPTNGGAYTVSKENLGQAAGLFAATALMLDYVLNVAVGISAGIGALTSAVPSLQPYTLELCLAVLAIVTLVNLRGTLESGVVFALPTYTFIVSFLGIIAYGIWNAIIAEGAPIPVVPPPALPAAAEGVTLWLLLRAFAAGCTAMTGVEAVSNGVSAFREPRVKYAHRTLTTIVLVLGALLAGIAYLAQIYNIGAMDQTRPGYQSVLSQLAGAVIGRGWIYFIAIGSLLAVLSLSANTSFVDFPRMCRLVAADGYLPRAFAVAGRRLVFSVGIIWLAVTAGLLLTVFGGITDRLIPLFAVGAFLAFTMSQLGMAMHWYRQWMDGQSKAAVGWRLFVNGLGAFVTATSVLIIVAAKFIEGAWITVLAIPLVLGFLLLIRRYYTQVEQQLGDERPVELGSLERPIVLIPVKGMDRLTLKAVEYSLRLSDDVIAVHVGVATAAVPGAQEEDTGKFRDIWRTRVEMPARRVGLRAPLLVQLPSEYRSVAAPLLKYIAHIRQQHPGRSISVALPELVKAHWWDFLLHTGRSLRLRRTLLRHGGSNLAVVLVPWTLEEPRPEQVIAEEEPNMVQETKEPECGPANGQRLLKRGGAGFRK